MKPLRIAAATAVLMAFGAVTPAASVPIDKTPNVRLIASFPYFNGTDLAFSGDYVYAGEFGPAGGVHIISIAGDKPRRAGFINCPGDQNDVAVVRPGLLAMGYHEGHCGRGPDQNGVRVVDVSDPHRPRPLDAVNLPGGTHTLTVYPGKPIIYASPGGHANGEGLEQIIDASNPRKLRVRGTFLPSPMGCHDLEFHIAKRRKLAFCAGTHETQIWDVSKPFRPETIGRIVNPLIFFHHSAVSSSDGKLLVIGDEAFVAHGCRGGVPPGSLWFYDISDPRIPELAGTIGPRRGGRPVPAGTTANQWCTAHNYNFVPGTRKLVSAWFTAGTQVIDLKNPAAPREIGYFRPLDAETWSSYWYDGRIYTNDVRRGVDVIDVRGLRSR